MQTLEGGSGKHGAPLLGVGGVGELKSLGVGGAAKGLIGKGGWGTGRLVQRRDVPTDVARRHWHTH